MINNDRDFPFYEWKEKVDVLVESEYGIWLDDLPDLIPIWDMFDDNMTPDEALDEIANIFDAEFGFEEF